MSHKRYPLFFIFLLGFTILTNSFAQESLSANDLKRITKRQLQALYSKLQKTSNAEYEQFFKTLSERTQVSFEGYADADFRPVLLKWIKKDMLYSSQNGLSIILTPYLILGLGYHALKGIDDLIYDRKRNRGKRVYEMLANYFELLVKSFDGELAENI